MFSMMTQYIMLLMSTKPKDNEEVGYFVQLTMYTACMSAVVLFLSNMQWDQGSVVLTHMLATVVYRRVP